MRDVLVVGGVFREVLTGDTKPTVRYGGSGLVAAVAAARVGADVALASYVGDEDQAGVALELQAAGVDGTALLSLPGASGTFVFPTKESPERPWPMYRPAENVPTSPPTSVVDAAVVLAFGIPDYDPIAAGWLGGVGATATIIWDKQGWLSRARDATAVLSLPNPVKVYLANEAEAMEDAGATSTEQALASQPPEGFRLAVIKQGIRGVTVIKRSEEGLARSLVSSFPSTTRSSIGTGDIFAGVFAARLAKADRFEHAARWGCAAVAVALNGGYNLLEEASLDVIDNMLRTSEEP